MNHQPRLTAVRSRRLAGWRGRRCTHFSTIRSNTIRGRIWPSRVRKSYKERVTDNPRRGGRSWRGRRALGNIENRALAQTVAEGTDIQVSETDRPCRASEGYRNGKLSVTRCMI